MIARSVALTLALTIGALGSASAGQQAGKPAADFSLSDASQKTIKLGELRGKVVLTLG